MIYCFKAGISKNIIDLFRAKCYEPYVLDILNKSETVFPGEYNSVEKQYNGQPDYIEKGTQKVFDAKLPFLTKQMCLLTDGKKHEPQIYQWLNELMQENSEIDLDAVRNGCFDISETKLYQIMMEKILSDNDNENIIFFFPFPIGHKLQGCFMEAVSDNLDLIYEKLVEDERIRSTISKRNIYVVSPSGYEKNEIMLRNLSLRQIETIKYGKLEKYFSYEMIV